MMTVSPENKQDQELKERLRGELKTWERAFEKENARKPTAADVKAHSEISAKYKLYHKSFRIKSSSSTQVMHPKAKSEYESMATALQRISPPKRNRENDILTPVKGIQGGDDVETVGPTPQLNGRMLGLFDGIQEQTPLKKRKKLSWGEQLALARKDSPRKSTPRRRLLSETFPSEYITLFIVTKALARQRRKRQRSQRQPWDRDLPLPSLNKQFSITNMHLQHRHFSVQQHSQFSHLNLRYYHGKDYQAKLKVSALLLVITMPISKRLWMKSSMRPGRMRMS